MGQRTGCDGRHVHIVASLHSDPAVKCELFGWTSSAHDHCATGYVAAEEQALRSTKYLYSFQVEYIKYHARIQSVIHAVNKDAHGWIDRRD